MSEDAAHDPSHARFRRGAGSRVGPPLPPPTAVQPPAPSPVAGYGAAPAGNDLFAPPADRPIAVGDLPSSPGRPDPSLPSALATSDAANYWSRGSLFVQDDDDAEPSEWLPVDADPGRASGVWSIVVGAVIGVVGIFVGLYSIGRSRSAGLAGVLGLIGVAVSVVNMVVLIGVGISFARYEISLQEQCAVVGPGVYVTDEGKQVTCG